MNFKKFLFFLLLLPRTVFANSDVMVLYGEFMQVVKSGAEYAEKNKSIDMAYIKKQANICTKIKGLLDKYNLDLVVDSGSCEFVKPGNSIDCEARSCDSTDYKDLLYPNFACLTVLKKLPEEKFASSNVVDNKVDIVGSDENFTSNESGESKKESSKDIFAEEANGLIDRVKEFFELQIFQNSFWTAYLNSASAGPRVLCEEKERGDADILYRCVASYVVSGRTGVAICDFVRWPRYADAPLAVSPSEIIKYPGTKLLGLEDFDSNCN